MLSIAMAESLFGAKAVISQQINDASFKTYLVGFDRTDSGKQKYRLSPLIDVLKDALLDFAFAYHEDTDKYNANRNLREAARSIYKIKAFEQTRTMYEKTGSIDDDNTEYKQDKNLSRGEFGELILHVLLREYHNTVPLLSKIYFKDTYGATVHGFDGVHIEPSTKTLWLGESKLYSDGKKGVKSLINDVKNHFTCNYLHDEFSIISKKVELYSKKGCNDKYYLASQSIREEWLKRLESYTSFNEILDKVNIPLLCTYSSAEFSEYNNEKLPDFLQAYTNGVTEIKKYFDDQYSHNWTDLNIILLLFPVQDKNELVKRMHRRLYQAQELDDTK
jgi:hypothetical protein